MVELFRNQANKLIKSLTNASYEELLKNRDAETANVLFKLMTFLEFKYGKLRIKDQELLMQYQLFMTPEMIQDQKKKEDEVLRAMHQSQNLKRYIRQTNRSRSPKKSQSSKPSKNSSIHKPTDQKQESSPVHRASLDSHLKLKYTRQQLPKIRRTTKTKEQLNEYFQNFAKASSESTKFKQKSS